MVRRIPRVLGTGGGLAYRKQTPVSWREGGQGTQDAGKLVGGGGWKEREFLRTSISAEKDTQANGQEYGALGRKCSSEEGMRLLTRKTHKRFPVLVRCPVVLEMAHVTAE